ncbi:MAG: hypothetical protein GX325_05700 [Peptococcaceae bacterium]|nr:hypothetical protein [Peptococcaceae bacterium]
MAVKVTWTRAPSCMDQEVACKTRVRVTVTNTEKTAVKICELGARYPRRNRVGIITLETWEVVLEPKTEASAYLDIHQMRSLPRYDIIFAKSDNGRKYYPDVPFFSRIKRFLWWQLGFCPGEN